AAARDPDRSLQDRDARVVHGALRHARRAHDLHPGADPVPLTGEGMRALLLSEYKKLSVVEMPVPEIGTGDVLVRVRACGICGSDIHGYDGSTGRRIPPL